jgi:DNA replication protein DnaC
MNNNQATLQKLGQMKLYGMARALTNTMEAGNKSQFTADELISHLIDAEWDDRYNRKLTRLLKGARFRYKASFEEIDFTINRGLDKNQLLRLSNCQWIESHRDCIVTGPTGAGKSFIASALGHQACMYGFKVLYYPSSKLFAHLKLSRADGSYLKELTTSSFWMILVLSLLIRKVDSLYWRYLKIDMAEDHRSLYLNCR